MWLWVFNVPFHMLPLECDFVDSDNKFLKANSFLFHFLFLFGQICLSKKFNFIFVSGHHIFQNSKKHSWKPYGILSPVLTLLTFVIGP